MGFLVLVGGGVVGVGGYAIYDAIVVDEFALRKDSWECSKSHTETDVMVIMAGKAPVSLPQPHTVCDQYTRTH